MNAFDKMVIAKKLREEHAEAGSLTLHQEKLIQKRMTPQPYLFGIFQTKAMPREEAIKSLKAGDFFDKTNLDFTYAEYDRQGRITFLAQMIRMVRDVQGPTINLTASEYNRIMGFIY